MNALVQLCNCGLVSGCKSSKHEWSELVRDKRHIVWSFVRWRQRKGEKGKLVGVGATEGRREVRVDACQCDLWTPFEVSSLQPQSLPAAFQSRDILLAVRRGGCMTSRSLTSTSAPLTYTLPGFVANHHVFCWGFLFPESIHALPRHQVVTWLGPE